MSAAPHFVPGRGNLSRWAIEHPALLRFFVVVVLLVGVRAYFGLGQAEDPPFTFKTMLIQAQWPGATAEEVSEQLTERIEKTLQEMPELDFVHSYAKAGETALFVNLKETVRGRDVAEAWYQIRKKVGDLAPQLPDGVQGPFFNDEFGTTFGNIYALTGEGFDYAVLKDYADRIQLQLQRVKSVGKVELIGLQDEKVWIELSNVKLATLGVPLEAVRQALEAQNAVTAAGFVETVSDRVQLRVSGSFETVEQIRDFPIRVAGRTFRIGDVAEVHRGFNDPPAPRMRFMGEPALGLAVSMKSGGDILLLGEALQQEFARLQQDLPAGMQLRKVSDQPAAVKSSVGEFVRVLVEALAIVLLVSFFSLGVRTGLVVALSIPLVLAMTFAVMNYLDIGLHKISLGALVLALGLLVDDAIIAVEMMAIKMEQGYDRLKAASFAWTSTAFPMLTGTLITAAGFLPIATANSSTGEYTRSIFQVVTISLIATAYVQPQDAGSASSLFNILRNLGGAIGIALLATLLDSRSKVYFDYLREALVPTNPAVAERLAALAAQLGSEQAALGRLSEITHQQALIMAYNDAFHFVCIALAISMLAVVLTRPLPQNMQAGAGGH
jgi:multidrug efflux pump